MEEPTRATTRSRPARDRDGSRYPHAERALPCAATKPVIIVYDILGTEQSGVETTSAARKPAGNPLRAPGTESLRKAWLRCLARSAGDSPRSVKLGRGAYAHHGSAIGQAVPGNRACAVESRRSPISFGERAWNPNPAVDDRSPEGICGRGAPALHVSDLAPA